MKLKIKYYFDNSDFIKLDKQLSFLGFRTYSQLAFKLGVSNSYLSSVLKGKKCFTEKIYSKLISYGFTIKLPTHLYLSSLKNYTLIIDDEVKL